MNPFPIGYAFRPGLRGRLTLSRLPLPRKPLAFGGQGSHLSFRYSCLHSRFRYLQAASRLNPSAASGTFAYHLTPPAGAVKSAVSVRCLSPDTLSAHGYSTSELLRTL